MDQDSPAQAEARHQLFLSRVTKHQKAWGLKKNDGWANWSTEEGDKILPLWSDQSQAKQLADSKFSGYSPACIPLDKLLDEMLPALTELAFWIGTNLTNEMTGIELPAERLLEQLRSVVVT